MGNIVKSVKKIASFFDSRYHWLTGLVVLAALFLVARIALADGLTDVSAVYEPICDLVKQTTFLLITSAAYIFSMSHLLQWILIHPEWLNLHTSGTSINALVATGLNFSKAFANMLLIIAFLAIAFGFIFKVETFQSKKALPLFFIVAILANFAPTFVGMIVDISTVINNTLILGSQATIVSAFNQLVGSMVQSIISLGAYIVAAGAGTVLPEPFDDAFEILNIGYFVAFLLPVLPIYFAQIMVGFAIGGILFTYVIFFMSRIYIIQFITIVSPLAVVAYALPQTRHYYSSIFSELIKWTFVGNITLFLLVIGLRSATSIMPNQSDFISGSFGIPFQFQGYLAYYLCLFIYMAVIQTIATQNMPAMGSMIQQSFGSLGGMMMSRAVSPAINNMNQRVANRKNALADVDESKLTPEELQRHQINKAVTGVAAGTLGLGAGLLQNRNWKQPITASTPYLNDTVREKMGKIKEEDSLETSIQKLGIKNTRDYNSDNGAALIETYKNSPDKLRELQKKLGPQQFNAIATELAAKKSISKDTFTKAVGLTLQDLSSDEIEGLRQDKNVRNLLVPKGIDDPAYKRAMEAGYDATEAYGMAVMEGFAKGISKDVKNIGAYKLGNVVEKEVAQGRTETIDAINLHTTGITQQKILTSMKPNQRKIQADRIDTQDTEYLANTEVLTGKSASKKYLIQERAALKTPKLDKFGHPVTDPTTGNPILVSMADPERNTARGRLAEVWENLSQTDKEQKHAAAKARFTTLRNTGNMPPGWNP